MSNQTIPYREHIQDKIIALVETDIQRLIRARFPFSLQKSDKIQAFADEHEIPIKALYRDGLQGDFQNWCTDVELTQDHRFTFRDHRCAPTKFYRALVFPVRDKCRRWIDLVAFVPEINKAALFLGATGVLGARRFAHRQARRGLRVFVDPMLYLRNQRYGLLIIDPRKAALELKGRLLLTQTVEEAEELAKLTLGLATIVVQPRRRK